MRPPVNQDERAARLWPFLVAKARVCETVSYGEVGGMLGIHHRPVRFVLERILQYCDQARKPILTAIVVGKNTGKPGSGIKSRIPTFSDDTLGEIFGWNWENEPNPFEWAVDGTTDEELESQLLATPPAVEEVYAKVKVRGMMQILFRRSLLRAYDGACCFSGLAIPETLEAAHVVPWSHSETRLRGSVNNGLLVSSLHHKLFETGLITLTPDLRIWCDRGRLAEFPENELMHHVAGGLHGRGIRLPRNPAWCPAPDLIERHNLILQISPSF